MRTRRRLLCACVMAASVAAAAGLHAQAPAATDPKASAGASEYAIKAAFLCKFPGYVEWPPQAFDSPEAALTIGVLASDPVFEQLVLAAGQAHGSARRIVARRLARGSESLGGVHILFIAATHDSELNAAVASAKDRPVLIVTETDGTLARGSMINFVVEDDRVRFDIAAHVAELHGLKISARLLGVARRVAVALV